MPEAHIAGYGSALPWPITTERFLEVDREARLPSDRTSGTSAMVRKIAHNTGIKTRHFVSPAWLHDEDRPEDVEDIFTPHDFDPPGNLRARFWKDRAPKLAIEAARDAIANWGGSLSDITHVVTTCTSGWSEPGISAALIHELGLSLDTQKQELNFNGCFCGATCLRIARDIVRAGDARAVLVVAVETASVQYDPMATDISSLIATSLFADGAAAFILAPEGEWVYKASGMSLVPDTADWLLMSPDLEHDRPTYRMFLHRQIGSRLASYFRDERGAGLLGSMLERIRRATRPRRPSRRPEHPRVGVERVRGAGLAAGRDAALDRHALRHGQPGCGGDAVRDGAAAARRGVRPRRHLRVRPGRRRSNGVCWNAS